MSTTFLAIGFGCLIVLAIGEVGVRVLDVPPRPLEPIPIGQYRLSSDPILLYEYRPEVAPEEGGGWASGFATNVHGFRDRERSVEKPPGTRRVLVLGDSLTAGNGIRQSRALFPQRLERLLDAEDPDATWEVLNMGVGGYHTLQEVELLRVKGLAFDPDIVLIAFCINDFAYNADGGVHARLLEANPGQRVQLRSRSLLGGLLGASRLAFVIHHHLRTHVWPAPNERWYADRVLAGRSTVEAGLDLLAEIQRDAAFDVLIFIIPGFGQPIEDYRHRATHDRLVTLASRYPRMRVVDFTDTFAALDPDLRSFASDGLHLTPRGHAVLARALPGEVRAIRGDSGVASIGPRPNRSRASTGAESAVAPDRPAR